MRVAVIDVGTNSVRLLVADVKEGKVVPLHTNLITTRLGQGIENKYLLPGAMERTLRAVEQFMMQARELKPVGVLAAATSAVRDAKNRNEFVGLVKDNLGLDVRILSGKEEAYFTYKGVLAGLNRKPDKMALIDLGGGSTEFIWQAEREMHWESVNVGAVRATEGNYSDGTITRLLKPVMDEIRKAKITGLVGVGGTATNLAAVSLGLKVYDPSRVHGYLLTLQKVQELLDIFKGMTVEERKKIPGLQPERADIIEAGTRIVSLIMRYLEVSSMIVSEADILYGLALEAEKMSKEKM